MDNNIRANNTSNPEYTPLSKDHEIFKHFKGSEIPSAGTYDPEFGIKYGRGCRNFCSLIMWLSKDKLTFYVKFNLGPYDWKSA